MAHDDDDLQGLATSTRFVVRRRLGKGANGVVVEAHDRERDIVIALKMLRSLHPEKLWRFKQEFRSLADVVHPNLARLHELHVEDGHWFLTMELVDGLPFASAIRNERGELDVDRLRASLRQLTSGLRALHAAGKLHRDIKHTNVLVTAAPQPVRVVVLDFGLVTDVRPGQGRLDSEQVSGTPSFMAPELFERAHATPASDWYAVGVMLHETLTGRQLFSGDLQTVMQAKTVEAPRPSSLAQGIPLDLESLCLELLRRDPALRPRGSAILARLEGGPRVSTQPGARPPPARAVTGRLRITASETLVGRDKELEAMTAALSATRQGRPLAVLVRGASGMGKSALLQRFLENADSPLAEGDARPIVLAGRCFERESVPYKALDAVIDGLSAALCRLDDDEARALLPDEIQSLARLFPVLSQVPAVGPVPPESATMDPLQLRRVAFNALRELLVNLAAKRPVIIAIDDLQWGDVDSAVLIEEILRPPHAPAVLLVAAYRSEEAASSSALVRLRRALDRDSVVVRDVPIGALDPAAALQVARELLIEEGIDDDDEGGRARAIARESAGHPIFLEALARFQTERSALSGDARADLRVAINVRVRALPDDARRILEVTALASRPLERKIVAEAAGVLDDEGAFAMLRAGHLSRSFPDNNRVLVEAYHDRIRETVIDELSVDHRRTLHRSLAKVLLRSANEDPEILAHHLEQAGDEEGAAQLALDAAHRATAKLAFHRATRLYAWALKLLPTSDARRPVLEEQCGHAHANAGQGREAAAAFLRSADLVDGGPSRDTAKALDLRRLAAQKLLESGRADDGMQVLRRVLGAVGMDLPRSTFATLRSVIFNRTRVRLTAYRFNEREERAIPRDELLRVDLCHSAAMGMLSGGEARRFIDFLARFTFRAIKAGEPRRIALALNHEMHAVTALFGPKAEPRIKAIEAAVVPLIERLGDPYLLAHHRLYRGVASYFLMRFPESAKALDDAMSLLREQRRSVWPHLVVGTFYVQRCLVTLDRWVDLDDRIHQDVAEARAHDDLYAESNSRVNMSLSALMRDDDEGSLAAIQEVRAGWSTAGYQVMHWVLLESEVRRALVRGEHAFACKRLAEDWEKLRSTALLQIPTLRVLACQLRASALLAAAQATTATARLELVREASKHIVPLERIRDPWANARASLLRAGAARITGAADDVVIEHLERAVEQADRATLRLHAAIARWRLGHAQGGDGGAALVESAARTMRAEGIVSPQRFLKLYGPGFDDVSLIGARRPS